MKIRGGISLVLFFVIPIYIFSNIELQKNRIYNRENGHGNTLLSLSPVVLKFISGEFKGLFSDYILMEAGNIIGRKQKNNNEDWIQVTQLFKQSMLMDPYFQQTYMLIQGTLPWYMKDYETPIEMLNDSKEHRYWDWIPGFFIGFDYFYFLKDNMKASEVLMDASKIDGAPPALATFAARLALKSGRNQTAISFLTMILSKEKDKEKIELIKRRISAHYAVAELEKAIQIYVDQFGKYPESLQILVEKNIIKNFPTNPYNKPFTYNHDTCEVTF